jgi:16S rRNA processing protein RimM
VSVASDTLVLGKIGAPYGVKGWLKITSYTENMTDIFDYSPWYMGEQQQEYQVEQWRTHNKSVIAKLQGVNSRDDADAIKHQEILVETDQLPDLEKDQFYWRDLIGMQVVTEQGYQLGKVKTLMETGANDVLMVDAKTNDAFGQTIRLIPYLPDQVIKHIDRDNQCITVDWDPGF